ncbi:MAG: fumarate reductase cytochrome b subunit [Rubrivivax sp.]|nr:fumarate reductase cytochrome b subunit [Rubrivivax sp.]
MSPVSANASRQQTLVDGVGLTERPRKSRWPARLDLAQSVSGGMLALFMWGHMFFVSSILVSPDVMWMVTKAFEGYFVFGTPYPLIVSGVVAVVLALVVGHALLAMRKFPGNWRQLHLFRAHRRLLGHEDTTLWWVQAVTGFALFFLASVHLYQMLMHPGAIGPYESAARVWHGWWPLYLVLLLAVELHGGIGLYRLAVKWGWMDSADPDRSRRRLRTAKWALTVFFLVLGLFTLGAYLRIGHAQQHLVDPVYTPAWLANPPTAAPPAWWPSWLERPFRIHP